MDVRTIFVRLQRENKEDRNHPLAKAFKEKSIFVGSKDRDICWIFLSLIDHTELHDIKHSI